MGTKLAATTRTWQKRENNEIQEKSGPGFDIFLTLNSKPLIAGSYRIDFQGEARVKAGGGLTSQPKFRIKVDGVTRILRTLDASNEWDGRVGWDVQPFNDGDTPVIIVEVQRFGGSETIEVQKLKLALDRKKK